jgi:HPt (histidine-containing phosphotransfer) domain-containing protein
VREALDRADAAGAAVAAHTLKGAVGNLRAPKAFRAAERLETVSREGNLQESRTAYAAAEREIADLLTTFHAVP